MNIHYIDMSGKSTCQYGLAAVCNTLIEQGIEHKSRILSREEIIAQISFPRDGYASTTLTATICQARKRGKELLKQKYQQELKKYNPILSTVGIELTGFDTHTGEYAYAVQGLDIGKTSFWYGSSPDKVLREVSNAIINHKNTISTRKDYVKYVKVICDCSYINYNESERCKQVLEFRSTFEAFGYELTYLFPEQEFVAFQDGERNVIRGKSCHDLLKQIATKKSKPVDMFPIPSLNTQYR